MPIPSSKMPSHSKKSNCIFALQVIEHFGLIFWLGTTYAISLLALPKAFAVLPVDQAGTFAQALFPAMNLFTALALAVVMGCYFFLKPSYTSPSVKKKSALLLLCAGLLGLNALVVQPRVHALRSQRQDPVKNQSFRMLHGVSMLGNLVIMLLGIPIVVWTTAQTARRNDALTQTPNQP